MQGVQKTTAETGMRRRPDRPLWASSLRRALSFLVIALVMTFTGLWLLRWAMSGHLDMDHPSIGLNLGGNALLVVLGLVLPTVLVRRVTGDKADLFGWGGGKRDLLLGLAGGLAAMALLMAVLAVVGGARFNLSSLPLRDLAIYGAAYAAIFALTALSEEGMLRGYVLIQLSRGLGFWPAAMLTSAIFAALHLVHGNESAAGLAQVGLFGLVMAISVARTGGLWFALGFHAAWDFAETYVFGVADSGMSGAASLLTTRLTGPEWLTGGNVGPEGSLLILPLLVLTGVAIRVGLQPQGER